MARPVSLLGNVKGMTRDNALDMMPRDFVWDLVDYIPQRRSAKLDGRGAWSFFTPSSFGGTIWGGRHTPFRAGEKLLVHAGSSLYDVNPLTGAYTSPGTLFTSALQNAVMLNDRVYFPDGSGLAVPKVVTNAAGTLAIASLGASAPKAKLLARYKGRLVAAGDPAAPENVYFSLTELDGGPLGTWDSLSVYTTSLAVTGLWPMSSQVLVFHDGSIEKLKGDQPVETGVDGTINLDPFSDQIGCRDPASIVAWQENVVWAAPQGIYLSDGATIRSLTDQGGMGDLWRTLYSIKRSGTQVVACVFLDMLFVTVLTSWNDSTPEDARPVTLVCDLNERTWWRFTNINATAMIPSRLGGEEVWWGTDSVNEAAGNANRLSKLSPVIFDNQETMDGPYPDTVDGNGKPVLPRMQTGWIRIGPEAVKRLRHIYVSHVTQTDRDPTVPTLQVGYKVNPFPFTAFNVLGGLPAALKYKRNRVRMDKRGYGVMVEIRQIQPTHVSRLYDVQVGDWIQDGGKL